MSQDINVNAFAETLNDKLDRDLKNSAFNMDLVIAYKAPTQDDPTWYRQYKSGWIEQGGKTEVMASNTITTITFPISMIDTNYTVTACERYDGGTSDSNNENYWISTLNVSSMGVYNSAGGYKQLYWEVKGFAANPAEGGDDESTYGNVYKTYFYNGTDLDYANAVGPYTVQQMAAYSIPKSGVILGHVDPAANTTGKLKINDKAIWGAYHYQSPVYIPVKKGDVFSYENLEAVSDLTYNSLLFVPFAEPKQSTDITITTLVDAMYPVGSIYIGTTVNCPLASIVGTWTKIDENLVLQSSSQAHQANTTIAPGLPNISGNVAKWNDGLNLGVSGPFYVDGSSSGTRYLAHSSDSPSQAIVKFNAARCSSVYGNSDTVQPPAYVVNIWKRTA